MSPLKLVAPLLHGYLSNIHLLNPVLQLQLPHDYFHLVPDYKGRGAQPLGNLLVGEPLGDQGYYFLFLMTKLVHPIPINRC
jgi:hypothetical protein